MDQWEYKVELIENTGADVKLHHVLNRRGSEGWELVSLAPRVKSAMGGIQGGDMIAVFKRQGVGTWDPKQVEPPGVF
jgi:hypothetical protein